MSKKDGHSPNPSSENAVSSSVSRLDKLIDATAANIHVLDSTLPKGNHGSSYAVLCQFFVNV